MLMQKVHLSILTFLLAVTAIVPGGGKEIFEQWDRWIGRVISEELKTFSKCPG